MHHGRQMNEYVKILGSALWIWKHELASKHRRDLKRIVKEIYAEESKAENDPENANHQSLHEFFVGHLSHPPDTNAPAPPADNRSARLFRIAHEKSPLTSLF